LVMKVDKVAERPNLSQPARLARSVTIDIALHFERPFLTVLAPAKCLGHIVCLKADLNAPVPGLQLSEGR
jgi:hypothetical protein